MTQLQTLAGLVREQARIRGERPWLHFEGSTFTYADLDVRTDAIASALAADGVRPGDRVAMLDKNTPRCLDVMFAAAKCGAVYVPLNWRLAAGEVAAVLADAQPRLFIVGDEFAAGLAGTAGDAREAGAVRLLVDGAATDAFEAFGEWLAARADGRRPATVPWTEPDPGDVALQLYTSGTTGLPKGVMLTGENLLGRHEESARLWGYDEDSVNLVVSPLFHVGGTGTVLLGAVTGGSTVMLRMADPAAILSAVDTYGVTNGLLVPAIIGALLQTPGCEATNWSNLRALMYGASPISDTLLRRAMAVMDCDFIQLYGITEHSGCLTYLAPEDHDPVNRPGLLRSCGRALPWAELRILDPERMESLPAGEVGEVAIRSTQVMAGYWRRPEETTAVLTSDGWFRTGDAGYLDADGYLYLHDRIKDMIVSGAENIYPAEIENVLARHEAVADVAVIGIPHERWGETPHAVVVLAEGYVLDATLQEEIIAWCRAELARYKVPSSVEAVDVLPRNAAGKVLKRELREREWAGHNRRIG
jgi:long-chain acyl-CoA synthetase